ncbi:hypothetical protein SPSIL_041070 [Sporomusa silvacetica DSM 10669]|uniref:Uncharacterized protein n=1 Tax=Sporomusa silvacetica DSM 10669 TaxID=1123289 RepID=A0ABZ3IR71_9FIRM|nr:hypothetical protein SPSIL_04350 [Sporomusa silvacetica DSM 10669]
MQASKFAVKNKPYTMIYVAHPACSTLPFMQKGYKMMNACRFFIWQQASSSISFCFKYLQYLTVFNNLNDDLALIRAWLYVSFPPVDCHA